MQSDISNNDKADYVRYKFQMRNGFEQAIKAIEVIRDRRLYRTEYVSFEEFCQKELSHTRQHVNRLIKAANVILELEPNGFQLDNERQARVLSGLTGEQQRDILAIAKVTAPEGKVTAAWIESTVNVMRTVGATGGYVDVGDGAMTPISAAITQDVAERKARQMEYITDSSSWQRIATAEVPARKLRGIEQFNEPMADIDDAEIVKVTVYKPKQ